MHNALIVGAGISGFLHALAFRSAGIEIATVFDPDLERATLLASLVGGTPTDSFARTVATDTDVAAICSPPPFHVDQAEALARPNRLIFVEKPVALNPPDLDRLRELPNVIPVLQWRSGHAARELRSAMHAGTFGSEPSLVFDLRLWRDDEYFAGGRRGSDRWGCGAMLSIGIHAIDLLLWMARRPIEAWRGREWRGRPGIDVTTGGELSIFFEGGARAELHLTVDAENSNAVRLTVHGGDVAAEMIAGEGDPTASRLSVRGRGLRDLPPAGGAAGSPLLVPFIHEALAAFESRRPTLTIDDVAESHMLAFLLRDASLVRVSVGAF